MSERKARGERCDHGISIWLSCYECKVYDAKKISEELENLRAENERLKEQMKVYDRMCAKGVYYTTEEAIARSNELTRIKSAAQKLVDVMQLFSECPCDRTDLISNAIAEWKKEMGDEQKESGNV